MAGAKNRIMAVLLGVTLVFAMASAAAVRAFADELTVGAMPQATDVAAAVAPQAKKEAIAYDSVYGVIGGEYALMMKTVALDGMKTATVTDVVKSDGTVVVHTSTATDRQVPGLGEWTDYEIGSVYGYADDVSAGYVMLIDKGSGKVGLKKLEGDGWLIPCAYDALVANEIDGGFVGFEFGTPESSATTTVTFFNPDGSKFGRPANLVVDLSAETYRYASASETYGYLWVCVAGSSDSASVYFVREGEGYRLIPNLKRIFDQDDDGSLLLMRTDEKVYYRLSSAPPVEVEMEAGGAVSDCWISGDFVVLAVGDLTVYCNKTTGKQVKFEKREPIPEAGDTGIPEPLSGSSSSATYTFGGKTIFAERFYSQNEKKYVAKVTDGERNPVKMSIYTLGIAADCGEFTLFNSVKRGGSNAWWATNTLGKWGAISSNGTMVVPFEFESYYDAGFANTNYVLVKKDGSWRFYDIIADKVRPPSGGGDDPDDHGSTTPSKGLPTGGVVTIDGAVFKVSGNSPAKVTYLTAPKAAKSAVVPDDVVINGKRYAVAGIGGKAFAGSKVKTVTIKSAKLTKKGVKNSFKGSKVKTVKVSVGSKAANKKTVKKYKKFFTKANCGAKVKVK